MSKAWVREYQNKRAEDRKRAGLCRNCPLPALPGETRCTEHKEKQRLYNKAYRIEHGDDASSPAVWSADDKARAAKGRCKCGLLLPCTSCLPTSAVDWRAYAGGSSQ